MNITEEEFKASITDKSKRVYMEIALSDLLDILILMKYITI